MAKVRDLLGDSGQIYFMAKLQGPRVTDGRLGTAKGHPCVRKQPGPPPLQVPTARSSCGYPTGIDPGPEGQDPVRKGQLWQQGICPVTTRHLTGKKSVLSPPSPSPFASVLLHSPPPPAQSTQKPALRAHLCGPLRQLCWRELVQQQGAITEGFSQEAAAASHHEFLKPSPGNSLAEGMTVLGKC